MAKADKPQITVGDQIWFHEPYSGDRDQSGRPIFRTQFFAGTIVSETSTHWVVKNEIAPGFFFSEEEVSKRTLKSGRRARRQWMTAAEKMDRIWLEANHWRLREHIGNVRDVTILRQVAKLVGYKENVE